MLFSICSVLSLGLSSAFTGRLCSLTFFPKAQPEFFIAINVLGRYGVTFRFKQKFVRNFIECFIKIVIWYCCLSNVTAYSSSANFIASSKSLIFVLFRTYLFKLGIRILHCQIPSCTSSRKYTSTLSPRSSCLFVYSPFYITSRPCVVLV